MKKIILIFSLICILATGFNASAQTGTVTTVEYYDFAVGDTFTWSISLEAQGESSSGTVTIEVIDEVEPIDIQDYYDYYELVGDPNFEITINEGDDTVTQQQVAVGLYILPVTTNYDDGTSSSIEDDFTSYDYGDYADDVSVEGGNVVLDTEVVGYTDLSIYVVWDLTTGILEQYQVDSTEVSWNFQLTGSSVDVGVDFGDDSLLPINPAFMLAAIFAIPIVRKIHKKQ